MPIFHSLCCLYIYNDDVICVQVTFSDYKLRTINLIIIPESLWQRLDLDTRHN